MAKKSEQGEISGLNLGFEDLDVPKKSYVPEGYETVEDYLTEVRETYANDLLADEDNRRAALEDKKFVAGEQWDPQVLAQRQGLPCLTINTVPQFTAQLVGDWRENKIAVKVLPKENGDKETADIRADLIRSIETNSRADRVYNDAFESMVQCGDGAFRVGLKYTSDNVFDQDIVLSPIDDALSVVWDSLSIDPTGKDATHCFVDDIIPIKEFRRRWPDVEMSSLSERQTRSLHTTGWLTDYTARITEHWRIIERKKMIFMFEDGSMHTLEENDYPDQDKLSEKIDSIFAKHGQPVKARLAPCRYAQMHVVTGFAILAGPYEWKMSRLPIIRMSGRTVSMGDKRVRYSIVRFIKDVVRLRNFWRSQAAEMLGYMPKAQWMATESAVEGREDAIRRAHLSRDPLLIFNDDAEFGSNVQRVDPPQLQTALLNEAQINAQDIKDVTGIHDASLGIKSNETSGKAIMARQREGDVASLTYYDNGNAAVLEAGDVINQLISQIYDGTRIIRIVGEDEKTKFININDPADPASPNLALGTYDVAMTSGASYTTRRVEAAEAMMEAIQVYPELMQVAGDLIVAAQEWPGAEELAERLRKTVPPQLLSDKEKAEMGDQPDVQGIMQQQAQAQEQLQAAGQELQKLQQENQSLKIKAAIEAKKIQIDEYRAETDRLTAYAAILKDNENLNLQRMEQEASNALAVAEGQHSQNMDVANLLQKDVQFNKGHEQADDQFAQSQEAAAEDRKIKQTSSGQKKSPPSSN